MTHARSLSSGDVLAVKEVLVAAEWENEAAEESGSVAQPAEVRLTTDPVPKRAATSTLVRPQGQTLLPEACPDGSATREETLLSQPCEQRESTPAQGESFAGNQRGARKTCVQLARRFPCFTPDIKGNTSPLTPLYNVRILAYLFRSVKESYIFSFDMVSRRRQ